MMRRRDLLTFAGAATLWPVASSAQQPPMRVVGVLGSASLKSYGGFKEGFYRGLQEQGFVTDKNLRIRQRWAEGNYDRAREMAKEFADDKIDLLFASGNAAAVEAKKVLSGVPITYAIGIDPVAYGLAASMSRPGGNATGSVVYASDLVVKRFELLRDLVPSARQIAFLGNPKNANFEHDSKLLSQAVQSRGFDLSIVRASSDDQIVAAIEEAARNTHALIVSTDAYFADRRDIVVAETHRFRLPAIFDRKDYSMAGGLVSYGTSFAESYRQAGIYSGRILNGADPAELPIQLPTKFEIVINLNTARMLGITIPLTLQAQADEVIE